MAKPDILIVEDDAVLRSAYERKFILSGFLPRCVETIQAAIDSVAHKAPDLVLLDLSLRDGSGFEFLRKHPRPPRTFPVIVVTNSADPEHVEEGRKLGADDYVIKQQISMRDLIAKVNEVMAHSGKKAE
jgi:DNA-binding response OmpR family regulator